MKNLSVSFAESHEVMEIVHVDDLSAEEIAALWFTKDDYRDMSAEDSLIINSMMLGKTPNFEDCTRGLEGRTPEGSDNKKSTTLDAINAVIDEQDRQRARGIFDPEALAKVYMEITAAPARAAHKQGIHDSENVNEVELRVISLGFSLADSVPHEIEIIHKKGLRETVSTRIQKFLDRAKGRNGLSRTGGHQKRI